MKLNRKGYMLVEIIIASVLAMTVAYYLLNLTYRFKDTNEDLYHSTVFLNDKILITKNIMQDLERGSVTDIVKEENSNTVLFSIKLDDEGSQERRKLLVNESSIQYGKIDASNNFDKSDFSYYEKEIGTTLKFENISVNTDNDKLVTIEIPVQSIYGDEDYSIKLFAQRLKCNFLNTQEIGSYINYGIDGVNGCLGTFNSTHTMLAYVEEGVPYLISAGAAYCDYIEGTVNAVSVAGLYNDAKSEAVNYCNEIYAYDGLCETNTVWPMDKKDFVTITGSEIDSCSGVSTSVCGVGNVVMDNGDAYWLFPDYTTNNSVYKMPAWTNGVGLGWVEVNILPMGVRYVYKLSPDVCVTSGSGTVDDPYQIAIE